MASGSSASGLESETKTIIRGLLVSNPVKCTIQKLCKDYGEMVGTRIPYSKMGFRNIEHYLNSIQDTVRVHGSGMSALVEVVHTEKSVHISEMVARQKTSHIPAHRRTPFPPNMQRHRSNHQNRVHNSQTYPQNNGPYPRNVEQISGHLNDSQEQVAQKLCNNQRSLLQMNTNSREEGEVTNNLRQRLELQDLAQALPPINSQCQVNISKESLKLPEIGDDYNERSSLTDLSIIESTKEEEASQSVMTFEDVRSQVPITVQRHLHSLIQNHPDGIFCSNLSNIYYEQFKKRLNYQKYGYRSVIDMCSDLPEIFNYFQPRSDDFLLYDKHKPQPYVEPKSLSPVLSNEREMSENILSELKNLKWSVGSVLIPNDVVRYTEIVPRAFLNKDIGIGDYLKINVAEIYDPSKFWVYLTDGPLEALMAELQTFFSTQSNKYAVPLALLAEGLYCVSLFLGEYHRAVIINLLPEFKGEVKVLFVDYGTVGSVRTSEIYYLPKQFAKEPCQALRASLSQICPVMKNSPWSTDAINTFRNLIANTILIGEVMCIDNKNKIVELYLADVSDADEIFYINERLVDENVACYIEDANEESKSEKECEI